MGLIVALGDNKKAEGELFWDDGESIGELIPPPPFFFFQADLYMLIRGHNKLLSVGKSHNYGSCIWLLVKSSVSVFRVACDLLIPLC